MACSSGILRPSSSASDHVWSPSSSRARYRSCKEGMKWGAEGWTGALERGLGRPVQSPGPGVAALRRQVIVAPNLRRLRQLVKRRELNQRVFGCTAR